MSHESWSEPPTEQRLKQDAAALDRAHEKQDELQAELAALRAENAALRQKIYQIESIPLDATCGELSCDDCNTRYSRIMAENADLRRELEALQTAHDLLNKGFESTCELQTDLKQQLRKAERRCDEATAACAAMRFELGQLRQDCLPDHNGAYGRPMTLRRIDAALANDAGRDFLDRFTAAEQWKHHVLNAVKSISQYHSGEWAGDKEGWGFVFEVINWLRRQYESVAPRLEAAERAADGLAEALRQISQRDNLIDCREEPPIQASLRKWKECVEIAKAALVTYQAAKERR